ncbi:MULTISPECIES: 50S ribosomal protein L6 [Desulfofundulus]|uniref:Large ribosomal subunit protein uL6 n=1 Tax=Desulfofundulus australicus DSM 11792 TaxID=1121425 RepID=A0A1M4YZX7_9FIRM|nr:MULTISPECIES: 50S ribosomal protein L6 [Desulfofundulus]MBE3585285.1 50S ribosomal protein L6 [Thermoanaerobacter sp.]MCS5695158.1 50S ribosomal protein L6 [Desulfofundulus thermocisternus]SHF11062.1 large subunit ribosomal protein L6 [Desulfofundulus australicus DSM 11792]
MSRIGRKPIALPQGVEVQIDGNTVRVKGPKGQLEREFHRDMRIRLDEEGRLVVERPSDEKLHRSLHGLTRTLLANMVEGVTKGFAKNLELVGVGYRATKQGNKLVLSVGYSHPVEIVPPPGLEIEVPAPNKIVVKGMDKEKVGALAAVIRSVREPEPYKGKGIKYENEQIRRKAGKAGGKGKK